jgi:hypothetical protein
MKIKPEHLAHMKQAIDDTLSTHNPNGELVAYYEREEFARANKVGDLQKRFCFDLMYGAGLTHFVCKELYPYLNDNHIYTALKSICPKIEA